MSYTQENNPRRQKWINPAVANESVGASRPVIDTPGKLEKALQQALVVEHFTIPPYLCALYSIKEGTNDEAVSIIRTVVVEEMLHMVMVANLMNALGMKPKLTGDALIVGYPNPLPGLSDDFRVSLLKFSKESVNTFLRIERPAPDGREAQPGKLRSIGEFYEQIRKGLIYLEQEENEKGKSIFSKNLEKQVLAKDYYGAGGRVITVSDLNDAEAVIDEIEGQGEGIDGTINAPLEAEELAHYFRFNQIFCERRYKWGDPAKMPPTGEPMEVNWDAVYNMEPNPRMENYTRYPWLQEKVRSFNQTYCRLLENLHHSCNGNPELLRAEGVPLMFHLRTQAVELMKIPSGNGNYTAGPTFEYIKP